jgi:hypothetical protein
MIARDSRAMMDDFTMNMIMSDASCGRDDEVLELY